MTAGGDLVIDGLTAGYRGRPVLSDLRAAPMRRGQVTALVGPNAAGKSTLLRALAGLVPARGKVLLGDASLSGMGLMERARHVAYMPQALPAGVALTAFETLVGALRASPVAEGRLSTTGIERQAASVLARLGIEDLALRQLDRLSGGQRQMVGLAQALVRDPELLLLDEPTSALDLRHQFEVMNVVRGLAEEGRVVVVVMHDLMLAARWASHVVVLGNGAIEGEGAPQVAITPEVLARVYKVRARVTDDDAGGLGIHVEGPAEKGVSHAM